MSETQGEEDTGGCCSGLSPTTRKCWYYITNIVGGLLFLVGIIQLFSLDVYLLIIGSVLIIFAPLWTHNFLSCCKEMKNAARLSSTFLFLIFLCATITFAYIAEDKILCIISGILLAVSGVWYFLSFFEKGQKACLECVKACCCSSDNKN